MPYSISTSQFSFVQFHESDSVTACNFTSADFCLPVYTPEDNWFQFFITGDTEAEVDDLCVPDSPVQLGLVKNCLDDFALAFAERPSRYRINPTQLLYTWQHGFPNFDTVMQVGDCFHVRVDVGIQSFCSNCFQRIGNDCHTSVVQYSNTDNFAGFNYCASGTAPEGDEQDCEPLELTFINQATMSIPWTEFLRDKYGDTPTVQVWIQDENGELVAAGVRVALDAYPPNEIRIDFGGMASGKVKIM